MSEQGPWEGQTVLKESQVHQGLALKQAAGIEMFHSYLLALLAEAYRKGEQVRTYRVGRDIHSRGAEWRRVL